MIVFLCVHIKTYVLICCKEKKRAVNVGVHGHFCRAHRGGGRLRDRCGVCPSVRNAYKNLNNFVFVASISIKLGGKSGYTKFHILPNVKVTSRSKVTGRGQSTFGANVKFLGQVSIMAHNF